VRRTPPWAYRLYANPVLRAVLGWDWPRRNIMWIRSAPALRIVEIGSGGGFYTRHLVRRVDSAATVVIMDPCPSAVGALCTRLRGKVVGVSGVGEHLPFSSSSLDVLFYGDSLEEFDDPYRGISEAARVLRPGGQLVLFLWRPAVRGSRWRELLALAERDFALERACAGVQNIRRSYRRR
jgi:ubiquinone/menaquinone biosynthesis C-methylase UbiE